VKKNLLILAAALLLLALVVGVRNCREEAPRRDGFVFDTARAAEVTRLRVRYRMDSVTLITIPEGGNRRWVTPGDRFPVDTARLRKALGWLLRLQRREKVSDSASGDRLAEYGLDAAEAKAVEWTWASGQTVTLLLGKTSGMDFSYTYWKWADRPEVYRTPGNFVGDISPRAMDWKDLALWAPFTASEVRAVEADWLDAQGERVAYRVERAPGETGTEFRLVKPFEAPAASAQAAPLFEQAPHFAIDAFLEEDPDPATVSLEPPQVVLRILLGDGSERRLVAGPAFGGFRVARHPSHGSGVRLFQWRFDAYRKTPEQLTGR
jgi:hypothetical protein